MSLLSILLGRPIKIERELEEENVNALERAKTYGKIRENKGNVFSNEKRKGYFLARYLLEYN
jgi:hypothetical protein